MLSLPPLELLEATHCFPGPYTFKAIGLASAEFSQEVQKAVCAGLARTVTLEVSTRFSKGGKHLAVTVEVFLVTAAEVHAVYQSLHGVAGLVLLL